VPKIIAVTGHAGAGKTTAISYWETLGFGRMVYVGQFVVDEVILRQLTLNPENERTVRVDLRRQHGPAYLAKLAIPEIEKTLRAGMDALIDAVLSVHELQSYQERFGAEFRLVAIEADFETRASRLASRGNRSMTFEELCQRDDLERVNLRTDLVITAANFKIENNNSFDDLYAVLRSISI
jgi:dephospho-CoA kinase